ncbi:MAG: hypothetical protein GY716_14320 [bacterium]|nr:hypothetical protein [bacterium]
MSNRDMPVAPVEETEEATGSLGSIPIDEVRDLCAEVGQLCHKINNPLTSVMGRIQMMRLTEDPDEKTGRALDKMEESSQQIASLVRKLGRRVAEFAEDKEG